MVGKTITKATAQVTGHTTISTNIKNAFRFKENFSSIFNRPNDNYAAIDGLRGLSFVWMFMFHCFLYAKYHYGYDKLLSLIANSPITLNWLWNADKAVDTFFFLSGFLISTLLFKEHKKTQNIKLLSFYSRRYLRLTPVYLFSIFCFWVMRGPYWENLWQNVLYINNFFPYETMAMVWTWTLAVEEQFYLIFPLTLLFIFNRRIHLGYSLLFLFFASFAIRASLVFSDPKIRGIDMSVLVSNYEHLHYYSSVMYDNLYTRYGAFICGIFIAYLGTYHQDKIDLFFTKRSLVNFLNCIFLGTFILIIIFPVTNLSITYPQSFKDFYIISNRNLFSAGLAWIILLCVNKHTSINWLNRFLSFKAWFPLAQLSYSMYIFHIVFISFMMFRVRDLTNHGYLQVEQITPLFMLGFCFITLLITMLFSIFTYACIEKPFMNMRAKRAA
jgi:peptidoglycan/LPS O-acetylase OafA/YrhL